MAIRTSIVGHGALARLATPKSKVTSHTRYPHAVGQDCLVFVEGYQQIQIFRKEKLIEREGNEIWILSPSWLHGGRDSMQYHGLLTWQLI
jgi:hypothetical protein